jgi:hypothetical protein
MLSLHADWPCSDFFRVNGVRQFLQFLYEKGIGGWVHQFNFLFVSVCFNKFLNFGRYRIFDVSAFVFAIWLRLFGSVKSPNVKIPDVRIKDIFFSTLIKEFTVDCKFIINWWWKWCFVMSHGLQLLLTRNRFLFWKGFHYFILYFSFTCLLYYRSKPFKIIFYDIKPKDTLLIHLITKIKQNINMPIKFYCGLVRTKFCKIRNSSNYLCSFCIWHIPTFFPLH